MQNSVNRAGLKHIRKLLRKRLQGRTILRNVLEKHLKYLEEQRHIMSEVSRMKIRIPEQRAWMQVSLPHLLRQENSSLNCTVKSDMRINAKLR